MKYFCPCSPDMIILSSYLPHPTHHSIIAKTITMPKLSQRQALLKEITEAMMVEVLEEEDVEENALFSLDMAECNEDNNEDNTTLWDELAELILFIESQRFLMKHQYTSKSTDFELNYFYHLPDESFHQLTCTSKEGFNFILSEIKSHSISTIKAFMSKLQCGCSWPVHLIDLGTMEMVLALVSAAAHDSLTCCMLEILMKAFFPFSGRTQKI